jgi:hypothetical protein
LPSAVEQLRQAELDLDAPFLLVIVGEFNAGKSAFISTQLAESRFDARGFAASPSAPRPSSPACALDQVAWLRARVESLPASIFPPHSPGFPGNRL